MKDYAIATMYNVMYVDLQMPVQKLQEEGFIKQQALINHSCCLGYKGEGRVLVIACTCRAFMNLLECDAHLQKWPFFCTNSMILAYFVTLIA